MTSADPLPSPETQAIDADASVLIKRGIRILSEGRSSSAAEALRCFDAALELRQGLPIETFPMLRYGLAACWLNRAEALMRLDAPPQVEQAIAAFDEAITLLRQLPLHDDPRFSKRLAVAYQNRGLALQFQAGPADSGVIAAFEQAIAVLEDEAARAIPDHSYLLAAVWVNLAAARMSAGDDVSARHAAGEAMHLVAPSEQSDADAAEVGIKARYLVCRIIARRLSEPPTAGVITRDAIDDATDAVDDSLTIARHWERQGVSRFRELAYDLFRFGARVYAAFQPHFVAEFVSDNLNPDQSSVAYAQSTEMRIAGAEALALVADGGADRTSAGGPITAPRRFDSQ